MLLKLKHDLPQNVVGQLAPFIDGVGVQIEGHMLFSNVVESWAPTHNSPCF